MDFIDQNNAILEKYGQIVDSDYKEPGIDGHFGDCRKGLENDHSDIRMHEDVQSNR